MDLFPEASGDSPMEDWRKRNGVRLYQSMTGWRAYTERHSCHADTAEKALLAWADKSGTKCWKAEELERKTN